MATIYMLWFPGEDLESCFIHSDEKWFLLNWLMKKYYLNICLWTESPRLSLIVLQASSSSSSPAFFLNLVFWGWQLRKNERYCRTSNSWHYSCPRSVYCRSIVFLLVVQLFEIYRFIMKIFTHILYNRWDKYRKLKVPCTFSVRFTQLCIYQNILSFENSLF